MYHKRLNRRKGARYAPVVSDSTFEYGGVPAGRFAMWEDILKDVGFARGYGPAHGQPGYDEHQREAARAIELLWPPLALLPKHLDTTHPHVAAYLQSLDRTVEMARGEGPRPATSQSLALSQIMTTLEALLLGLIGPQGQSPLAPRTEELPTQPYFEAWLATASGSADLVPGPAARRTIAWRTTRACVLPDQAKEIAAAATREITLDWCRALIDHWNRKSTTHKFLGPADDAERTRFAEWQPRFHEVLARLKADLRGYAERGEVYLGWTGWYGHE